VQEARDEAAQRLIAPFSRRNVTSIPNGAIVSRHKIVSSIFAWLGLVVLPAIAMAQPAAKRIGVIYQGAVQAHLLESLRAGLKDGGLIEQRRGEAGGAGVSDRVLRGQ
jgi:hypothetical protein